LAKNILPRFTPPHVPTFTAKRQMGCWLEDQTPRSLAEILGAFSTSYLLEG
jgi:hypothetical protein